MESEADWFATHTRHVPPPKENEMENNFDIITVNAGFTTEHATVLISAKQLAQSTERGVDVVFQVACDVGGRVNVCITHSIREDDAINGLYRVVEVLIK